MTSAVPSQLAPTSAVVEEDLFAEYWEVLRPAKTNPRKVVQLAADPVVEWTLQFDNEKRPAFCTIPGNQAERRAFYQRYLDPKWDKHRPGVIEDVLSEETRTWMASGPIQNFVDRFIHASVPPDSKALWPSWASRSSSWELLMALASSQYLTVEEPLRFMVDTPHYLVHAIYRALWEIWFSGHENLDKMFSNLASMTRWLTSASLNDDDRAFFKSLDIDRRITSPEDRIDAFCFLFALAAQNGIINRAILAYDNLELSLYPDRTRALVEMELLITRVERWVAVGCRFPVGLLIGFDGDYRPQLRKANAELSKLVKEGLAWTTSIRQSKR